MSQFIGTSMPRGFAGDITRGYFDHTVEGRFSDGTVKSFGVPVKLSGDKVAATTATADVVYGFAARGYGQADCEGVQAMGQIGVLRRGYMAVASAGTPAAGAQVYLSATGTITAGSDSTTAIPGCTFMGAKDADGLVEIAFNI